jgi:TP901-1 family phage major tail protein
MTTGYSGRLVLLKVNTSGSPATYTTVAGLRDTTITINETEVDVTTKDDAGIRQLLDGNILSSVTVSGTGVFTDSATINTLRAAALAGTHRGYKIEVVDSAAVAGGTYSGSFRITSFENAGSYEGEVNYSITLASAGTVTHTT